jgi:hypothetical protein
MTLKTQKTPQYMTLETQKTPQYMTLKTQKVHYIHMLVFWEFFVLFFFKYDRYITLQLLLPHSCETYYVENLFRFL